MTNPFTQAHVRPHYADGFLFSWELSQSFHDAGPWRAFVEQAPSPDGPWQALSPELTRTCRWTAPGGLRVGKDPVLYFRIRLVTASASYFSPVITPYGELNRREYLIAREVIRKEILHMRTLAGVMTRVWLVSTFGPRCRYCIDPISGDVRDSACPHCMGTGRDPAYYGPYDVWTSFSNEQRQLQMKGDGLGTVAPSPFTVRLAGGPQMKKNDVVIDPGSDTRYYVDAVQTAAELRRVPLVQLLQVHEAPTTDIVYKVTE